MVKNKEQTEDFEIQKEEEIKSSWWKKIKINNKFFLGIVFLVFFSIALVGGVLLGFYKNSLVNTHFENLKGFKEFNKSHVESYFSNIRGQLITLSDNEVTVNALKAFSVELSMIGEDSMNILTNDDLVNINSSLKNYYNTIALPRINSRADEEKTVDKIIPKGLKGKYLQYHYISNNSHAQGMKLLLENAKDGSLYSNTHERYHNYFRKYIERFQLEDLYMVDNKGNVVYSVKKNIDYGTNLLEGPFKETNLAKAYGFAIESDNVDYIKVFDYQFYEPAFLEPEMFVSSPVHVDGKPIGVMIFMISIEPVNHILTSGNKWQEKGYGETGEVFIIGEDFLARSQVRSLVEHPDMYYEMYDKRVRDPITLTRIENTGSPVLLQQLENRSVHYALRGISGGIRDVDYIGRNVFTSYSKLAIQGLDWAIIAQKTKEEVLGTFRNAATIYVIIVIGILIGLFFLASRFSKGFANRIIDIRSIIETLSKGALIQNITLESQDEIGEVKLALIALVNRIRHASEFAEKIGQGEFDYQFEAMGKNDKLGISLTHMKNSLQQAKIEDKKRKEEDEKRNWFTQGIAKFSEITRNDNDNLPKLSYNILSNLVDYVGAKQGAIYIVDDAGESMLNLIAAYAYSKQKFINKDVKMGEGLVGTCAIEKKKIHLKDIPDDYIEIESGLGSSAPDSLLLVPLKSEEKIMGVIELATFEEFAEHQIDFIQDVSEIVASTISSVKMNAKTNQLLDESNKRASELSSQEEELRQNLEEMKATQEELERIKKQDEEKNKEMIVTIEKNRKMLIHILDNIPEKIYLKDKDGKFIIANSKVAETYDCTVDELIGKTDFDHYDHELATKFRQKEIEILRTGRQEYVQEEIVKGKKRFYNTIKMPFYIDYLDQTGLLGVQIDITDQVNLKKSMDKKKKGE